MNQKVMSILEGKSVVMTENVNSLMDQEAVMGHLQPSDIVRKFRGRLPSLNGSLESASSLDLMTCKGSGNRSKSKGFGPNEYGAI